MAMLRVVYTFGRERYEWQRFRNQGELARDARIDTTVRQTLFSFVVDGLTATGMAIVLGVGALHVAELAHLLDALEPAAQPTGRLAAPERRLRSPFGGNCHADLPLSKGRILGGERGGRP
jgi:hypothetical protein